MVYKNNHYSWLSDLDQPDLNELQSSTSGCQHACKI